MLDAFARLVGETLLVSGVVFGAFVLVAALVVLRPFRRAFDCAPLGGAWARRLLAAGWALGVLLVGLFTAPQIGAVVAVAGTLDTTATALIAHGLVEVGEPVGITAPDKPIDLARYATLADRLVVEAAHDGDGTLPAGWSARFWNAAATGVRAAVAHYATTLDVTPNDVAAWAWANSMRPALRAAADDFILADAVAALAAILALTIAALGAAWLARRTGRAAAPLSAA